MIKNHISGYLYNEHFCEINEEKGTAFQSIDCSQKYYKNCSTSLQAFSIRSISLHHLFPFS